MLAQEFLRRFTAEYNRPGLTLSPGLLQQLLMHSWPGNVRELQNVIERLVSLSTGPEITIMDLPDGFVRMEPGSGNGSHPTVIADRPFHEAKAEAIASFEKAYLQDLLRRTGGNISRAARSAGVDRKTIHRMLTKYEVEPPQL